MGATVLTDALGGGEPRPSTRGSTLALRGVPAALAVLAGLGAVLRVVAARQTLFGDELATYWDIHAHSLGGLISALHGTHIEITPPLFFVLAWVTSHIGSAFAWLRLPSLIAGTLTIPTVYALGARTLGRAPGLAAAALATLSPFMLYYSSEARAYALMMLALGLGTLALLRALERGTAAWWAAYTIAAAAALYSHYTAVFYLAMQGVWALVAHRERWRAIVLANLGVAVLLAPWAGAIVNAENSPTTAVMSGLSPFTGGAVRSYLEHWALGYAYPAAGGLSALPGVLALVLIGAGVLLGLAGAARDTAALLPAGEARRRAVLPFLLLLATPLGEALQSATGTHTFDVRNLAASWPAYALVLGWLLTRPRARLAAISTALALAGFAIGAGRDLQPHWSRPDTRSAAAFIRAQLPAGSAVVDGSGASGTGVMVTPGPLTSLDVTLGGRYRTFRAGAPQEREHPFGFLDPQVTLPAALAAAAHAAAGRPFGVLTTIPRGGRLAALTPPAGYRLRAERISAGILDTAVRIYAPAGAGAP
jgi:hypothetical protein